MVTITYFSDILCVWAYVAQIRVDEIRHRFGGRVAIEQRLCPVFASTAQKIGQGWAERGGYAGFNAHLRDVATRFDHIELNPGLWVQARPASSTGPHVFVKAVQLLAAGAASEVEASQRPDERLMWALRLAFFRDGRDIGRWDVQCDVARELGLPVEQARERIDDGSAYAALADDYQERERLGVSGSPTFILNEGRQKLYGNVGYRVIEANVQELLHDSRAGEASWC